MYFGTSVPGDFESIKRQLQLEVLEYSERNWQGRVLTSYTHDVTTKTTKRHTVYSVIIYKSQEGLWGRGD